MGREKSLLLNPLYKDRMWEQVLKGDTKVFSIYRNREYCGSVELQNPESSSPEIGIDLLECERNKGLAPKVVRLLSQTVSSERHIDFFTVRISSNNKHSIHVFEKMGAVFDGEEDSLFKRFLKNCKNVMSDDIQKKFKNYFGTGDDLEEEKIYRYKLYQK